MCDQPTRHALVPYAIVVLIGIACGVQPGYAQEDEPDAVYEYKKWECVIKGGGFILTESARITINNARGDDYNSLSVHENSYSKLKKASIKVLDAEGKELYKRKKKDMTKACGFGTVSLYTDDCDYYIQVEAPRYPYTIEYEYVLESKSLFFWRGEVWQHMIPVNYASYTLTVPGDLSFPYKVYGRYVEPRLVGNNTYVWEISDVPALDRVDYLPPGERERGGIEFAADQLDLDGHRINGCNWTSVGGWYNDLAREMYLEGYDYSPPADSSRLMTLMESAYDEVASRVRYVAISIGIGGWRPHDARATASRGYGDCKDMSTLLISKLHQQGIAAYPVLVLTRRYGPIDTSFPNFGFNHVITAAVLGNDTIWMDPTCDVCPFGLLPSSDENIDVLFVSEDGGVLRRTPSSVPADNLRMRTTRFHLGHDMKATFTTEFEAFGNHAVRLRGRLPYLDNDETRRYINRLFEGAEKKFRILSYEISNLDDLDEPVTIKVNGETIRPVDRIGGSIYCAPFMFNRLTGFETESIKDRAYALDLSYPRMELDSIEITWDSTLLIDSVVLPQSDTLNSSFGTIAVSARRDSDAVRLDLSKTYTDYVVEVSQFDELAMFRQRIIDLSGTYVKLILAN